MPAMRISWAAADKSRYGVARAQTLIRRAKLGIPFSFLLKGLLVGLALAAPLGPIGILCMNRTLAEGRRIGLLCGLGAAAADAVHALAGAVALAAIGQWIIDDPTALRVIGGVYLIYQGARTFMRPTLVLPPTGKAALLQPGAKAAFVPTFRLTLANPITLLGFAAMFAGLGVTGVGQLKAADTAAAALVLGVFLGSALWWLTWSSFHRSCAPSHRCPDADGDQSPLRHGADGVRAVCHRNAPAAPLAGAGACPAPRRHAEVQFTPQILEAGRDDALITRFDGLLKMQEHAQGARQESVLRGFGFPRRRGARQE